MSQTDRAGMGSRIDTGDVVLGNWTLTGLIGEGGYGRVYEARREDFGMTYKAAIKVITIPKSESELRSIRSEGLDDESLTAYFRSLVEEIVREFALMSKLKGTANVVSYEDHTVIPHSDGIGWDIIIRMELLTPLLEYTARTPFTRRSVIKLGIDMCKALELCQKFNIVHRDIKPENIFISELGDFKLGDFGIARTVEKTASGMSKKGTYTYMAPEVYREEAYSSSVDMYSLGIVLYRMLNENRTPFMPAYPAPITFSDQEAARAKRLSGAAIPPPKNADGRLAEIVLKCCAYDAKFRYSSPVSMRQELEAILYSREETSRIFPQGDGIRVEPAVYADDAPGRSPPVESGGDANLGGGPEAVRLEQSPEAVRWEQSPDAVRWEQDPYMQISPGTEPAISDNTRGLFPDRRPTADARGNDAGDHNEPVADAPVCDPPAYDAPPVPPAESASSSERKRSTFLLVAATASAALTVLYFYLLGVLNGQYVWPL